ncbi:MAG: magnesium chelatase subunit D [Rhodobacterales bacterium]|nr:magnesium chelatase subunit D [Rhodobacterales bacterium]
MCATWRRWRCATGCGATLWTRRAAARAWPGWWRRCLPEQDTPFGRATLALALLAIDPAGLGGMVLRARSGPVRDAVTALLPALPLPQVRLHPQVTDEALFGGLDLSATLAKGRIVQEQGLLARPAALVLTMAERCPQQLAARLAMALDRDAGHCLIALDEGAAEDERAPQVLAERLAFDIDLGDVAMGDITGFPPEPDEMASARTALSHVITGDDLAERIIGICAALGIDSLRAPLFALRAARAHAALLGHDSVDDDDLTAACALTLAHRATQVPEAPEPPAKEDTPPENDGDGEEQQSDDLTLPDELLLEAVRALLPPDLLARLAAKAARGGTGSGTGAARKGNRRGRPLPPRAGRLGNGARIDIVATLRAAAPWQVIRANGAPRGAGVLVRAGDIRLKRFEDKSDRLLIFAVDASGSAALARLAEAKGAVELLLAQAYARRDHVALIAFRGTAAEVLLPPTRSLVQTKRRLAALPGGGGTPLAAGLRAAHDLAALAKRRGLTPTLALLTDGRANIALDGLPDRPRAAEDALLLARLLRAAGMDGVVIDTGNRPEQALKRLAETMGALYLPLPRANAERLSAAVSAALG